MNPPESPFNPLPCRCDDFRIAAREILPNGLERLLIRCCHCSEAKLHTVHPETKVWDWRFKVWVYVKDVEVSEKAYELPEDP